MVDNKTPNFNLPLPDASNTLDVDVLRLISALTLLDTLLNARPTSTAVSSAISSAVSALVNSAPANLDTLGELAAAINNDPAFYSTVAAALAAKLNSTDAASTYLAIATAASTYLTITSAASTYLTQTGAASTYAPKASPALTGLVDLQGAMKSVVTAVAASALDCSAGNYFTKTATGALSWAFTNVPATGSFVVLLELTNGGTGVQSWPAAVKWPSGTAPTLTASGVDLLGFITDDGGASWRGVALMTDSK